MEEEVPTLNSDFMVFRTHGYAIHGPHDDSRDCSIAPVISEWICQWVGPLGRSAGDPPVQRHQKSKVDEEVRSVSNASTITRCYTNRKAVRTLWSGNLATEKMYHEK